MSESQRPEPPTGPSFEEAIAELDVIVRELEDGQIPLAAALARYEQGVKLLKHCYQALDSAGRRIEMLSRVDPDGAAQCEPFADEASSLEEKAQARSRRRSRGNSGPPQPPEQIDDSQRLF
jgi:exodeoxyribonuclease VII small subunit